MQRPVIAILWGFHNDVALEVETQLNRLVPEYSFKRNVSFQDVSGPEYRKMTKALIEQSSAVFVLYDPLLNDAQLKTVREEIQAIKKSEILEPRYIAPADWEIPSSPKAGIDLWVPGSHIIRFDDISSMDKNPEQIQHIKRNITADHKKRFGRSPFLDLMSVDQQVTTLHQMITEGDISAKYAKLGLMQAVVLPGQVNFDELRSLPPDGFIPREFLSRDIRYLKLLHSLHGKESYNLRQSLNDCAKVKAAPKDDVLERSLKLLNSARSNLNNWRPAMADPEHLISVFWRQIVQPDLTKAFNLLSAIGGDNLPRHEDPEEIFQLFVWAFVGEGTAPSQESLSSISRTMNSLHQLFGMVKDRFYTLFLSNDTILKELKIGEEFSDALFKEALRLYYNLIVLMHFIALLVIEHDEIGIEDIQIFRAIADHRGAALKTLSPIVNASNNLIWLYVDSANLSE